MFGQLKMSKNRAMPSLSVASYLSILFLRGYETLIPMHAHYSNKYFSTEEQEKQNKINVF